MKKILKFPIDNGTVRLKKDFKILSIQIIDQLPYIYVIADKEVQDDFIVCIILEEEMPILENYNYEFLGSFKSNFKVYHSFSITQK